jgi:pimeloyl-ACP methyl ester carboxylesterase
MKAHIIFGFTEGSWHGKRMRRELHKRGVVITKRVSDADYVIAHSGGCFEVPPLKEHQILMLINPTYWPGKPLHVRGRQMTGQLIKAVRPGNNPLFHLRKTAHNLTYLFTRAKRNKFIAKRAGTYDLETEIKHVNTILIRNQDDPWLTPELNYLQEINPHLRIVRMPGGHDDCWQHPARYMQILQEYRRA